MSALERLQHLIEVQTAHLHSSVPSDRAAALAALIPAIDQRAVSESTHQLPILLTGSTVPNLAGNRAIAFCLPAPNDEPDLAEISVNSPLDRWATTFLEQCHQLVEAELLLNHVESGFIRLNEQLDETLDAWIASKQIPTRWREHADLNWWRASLATQFDDDAAATVQSADASLLSTSDAQRFAESLVSSLSYQFGYPSDAVIGATPVKLYLDVLRSLIVRALSEQPVDGYAEQELIDLVADDLGADPFSISEAISAFTVSRENAEYHATVPGVAAASVVLIPPDRIVLSRFGLTTEPLLFLSRELRRRDAATYHNSSAFRERTFRNDLYSLFADKRFTVSTNRIELRRPVGDLRTDIDAAVFDRKTGTLGVFELKSQDPFARSTAELHRQRDNVLYANRQVSGVLDWIKREGGDEILRRIDPKLAKTFRVQKVFPFVLGRYLVHFNDGPQPDPRAAWSTWPQVLRLLSDRPISATDANPIASLHTRITKDTAPVAIPIDSQPLVILLDSVRIHIYPSFAAFQTISG